jgi:hypothetical protein
MASWAGGAAAGLGVPDPAHTLAPVAISLHKPPPPINNISLFSFSPLLSFQFPPLSSSTSNLQSFIHIIFLTTFQSLSILFL